MKFAILCIVLLCLKPSYGRDLMQTTASARVSVSDGEGNTESKNVTVVSTGGTASASVALKTPSSPASSPTPSPMASPPMVSTPSPVAPPPMVPMPSPTAPPPSPSGPPVGDVRSHLDVYFLVDTTKGMEAAIKLLQEDREDLIAEIYGLANEVRVGVGEYKDVKDSPAFKNILPITANQGNAASAILSLSASGGGDTKKEAQLYALETVATDSGIGFDDDKATEVVVWIGDQPGSDPALGSTEASATAALQMSGIQVVAIDVRRLNAADQATRITAATKGV